MTDSLTATERAQLEELRHRDSFLRDTLGQMGRILASRRFDRVQQRAKDFLIYIVAKALLGQAEQIKETTIAMAVFGESADYNPVETSKVRVAAADLRQRLAAYAEHEGQNDVIQILIPLNTYVPEIRDQRIAVAITAFENWHPLGEQGYLCAAITAEIAHQLGKAGLRAGLAETFQIGSSRRRYALRGSVESRDDLLRINESLADPTTGRILCSGCFEGPRDDVLRLTRDATEALLKALAHRDDDHAPVPAASRKRA